jgi:HD superfamily phosphodiesterase
LSRFYNISDIDRDIVVAGAILHDIQKHGIPWAQSTHHEHALIAYKWLDQFELKEHKNEIRNCVRYHMGQWSAPRKEVKRATSPKLNELIVQLADYLSSRKGISFLPGIDIGEERIIGYGAI